MTRRVAAAIEVVAGLFERAGIIDAERFYPTKDLAWPRIVTGLAIMSKQTADLAMVGVAVGTTATAGLAFALAYWEVVLMLGLGLAGGTVSLVSQHVGGERNDRASAVVTQSVLIALALATPIAALFAGFAEPLIGLLGAGPDSLHHGSLYLVLVAPAVPLEFLNLIASRTYTGVGDTYTEMVVRAGGALLNVALSAVLIFGFGLGVAGAAIGTAVATGFVTCVLAWGMVGRSYGGLGMAPIRSQSRPPARGSIRRSSATCWRSRCRKSASDSRRGSSSFRYCGSPPRSDRRSSPPSRRAAGCEA